MCFLYVMSRTIKIGRKNKYIIGIIFLFKRIIIIIYMRILYEKNGSTRNYK
jgi:hypothetical protein